MTRRLRERLAHAATPWEWRSRTSVLALVVAAALLPLAFAADAWINDGANPLAALIWWGGLGTFAVLRPAIRSLRPWDELHHSTAAA